ncbi:MAG: site-specific integrase [Holophagaceae bacterium]|nr:site-specific integrase [Holophagaceae bacterium]
MRQSTKKHSKNGSFGREATCSERQIGRFQKNGLGSCQDSSSVTVADAIHAYFCEGERRGMKSIARSRMSANAWIIPMLGNQEVSKLSRELLEGWLGAVAEAPRRVRTKLGQAQAFAQPPVTDEEKRARKDSANRVLTILKAALNYAVDREFVHIVDPPWRKIKPFRGTARARARFLSMSEQVKLLDACPPEFGNLVKGALLTGCRYSELARLRCRDYNSGTEIPTIFVAVSKSSKPRHIVLTSEGVALFEELTSKKQSPNDLIFTNSIKRKKRNGLESNGWLESDQKRYIKDACTAAGLERVSFHELRHTYASMLLNNKCPTPVVAQQLGHSDSRMVEKHYGHLLSSYVAGMVRATMPVIGIVGTDSFR